MAFTGHNIVLADGSETMPGQLKLIDSPWFLAAQRCLTALFPQGFATLRIADLACLEGGYATGFARMGFGEAVGIEVRPDNYANCVFVKERTQLANLTFVNDDVWNLEKYGTFDAIFCCGILYHLDAPRKFLGLMSRCVRHAVLINTHFATVAPIRAHSLSPIAMNEGLPGRWFDEGTAPEEKWAAWGNRRSFWILREYLVEALRDSGFPMVFEQYDMLGERIGESVASGYYKTDNRSMFVGVKGGI